METKLFSPVQLGPYGIAHRVVLAPLTRMRSSPGMVPNPLMTEYYTQRATAGGFMLTEATVVSPNGSGYYGSPGQFTDAQQKGWEGITSAVHAKGATIFNQLFHVGRESHVQLQPDGALPVGPSEVPHEDQVYTPEGWKPASSNRALGTEEIPALVQAFANAAKRSKAAGFDGIELHGANGYLFDQFLHDGSNKRTDAYGGPLSNRIRFLTEVVEAVVAVWGSNRVAVRLSPQSSFGSMSDTQPVALFNYVAERLSEYNLAYLHIIEPRIRGSFEQDGIPLGAAGRMKKIYKGTVIAAGGFDRNGAEEIIRKGDADLVAFGRFFVANPDLPRRLREDLPLNQYHRESFYGGDSQGYTDYPFYSI